MRATTTAGFPGGWNTIIESFPWPNRRPSIGHSVLYVIWRVARLAITTPEERSDFRRRANQSKHKPPCHDRSRYAFPTAARPLQRFEPTSPDSLPMPVSEQIKWGLGPTALRL